MLNTKRKILFFDIDGTLITNDGKRTFPESAKKALSMARENGHLTYINTGRVYANVEDFIKEGFDGLVCGCGTYICAGENELFHHKLDKATCYDIAKLCRDCNMFAIFEHTGHTAYDEVLLKSGKAEKGFLEILDYFTSMGRKMIASIDDDEFIFDKFAAWYNTDISDLEKFKEGIGDTFIYIQREGDFCEIIPKGFTKATGIKFLLDYYDIPIENAYAFGDSNNDLDMLKYVPNSIAMGVSTDAVLEVASYHTTDVMEDGIYNAMKHLEII